MAQPSDDKRTLTIQTGEQPAVAEPPVMARTEVRKQGPIDSSEPATLKTEQSLQVGNDSYKIEKLIGRGGMAEVYLAHRNGPAGFSRKVVLKKIRPDFSADPLFIQRFIREANVAAKLHHPNIVEIIELGAQDGGYFIVMEFLDGLTLRDMIDEVNSREQRCPPSYAAFIAAEIARALRCAHEFVDEEGASRPIVHRDVSPDNVMVTKSGQVKLLDFGVAKEVDAVALTQADQVVGKPLYLPPEGLRGAKPGPLWDLYGLGAVLYETLSGRPPFLPRKGPQGMARLLQDIAHTPAPPLRTLEPGIPEALEVIAGRALDKDPAQRQQSAAEFTAELDRFLESQVTVTPVGLGDFVRNLPSQGVVVPTPQPAALVAPSLESGSGAASESPLAPPMSPEEAALAAEVAHARAEQPLAKMGPLLSTGTRWKLKELFASGTAIQSRRHWAVLGVAGLAIVVAFGVLARAACSGPGADIAQLAPPAIEVPRPTQPALVPLQPVAVKPEAGTQAIPPAQPGSTQAAGEAPASEERPSGFGRLAVKCGNWGWVTVDGRRIGTCPIDGQRISAGTHEVTFDDPRAPKVITVVIEANKMTYVDFTPPKPVKKQPAGPKQPSSVMIKPAQ